MEEVVGSNPTRSTKTFQRLTVPGRQNVGAPESNQSPEWLRQYLRVALGSTLLQFAPNQLF
jgi:hypothetical protein